MANPYSGWTVYAPGYGGVEGGYTGNRDNPLNIYGVTPGAGESPDRPISVAYGPQGIPGGYRWGQPFQTGPNSPYFAYVDYGPGVRGTDVAVGGPYAPLRNAVAPGQLGNIFQRGAGALGRAWSTVTNPGRAAGNFWSGMFGGNRDLSPAQLGALGIPYYGEGSPTSQALGPLLERAFGPGGGQGGVMGMLDMTPGTGGPTRNIGGLIAGVAGNALVPGLGALTGPAARWVINQIQKGHFPQLSLPRASGGAGGTTAGQAPSGGGVNAGYSSPDYLRSIGYDPGQGTGSLWPGTPSGGYGGGGLGGAGGSFFGQLSGVRGGPLGGAFQGLGSGGGGSVTGGAEAALASTMLQNLRRGQGTPIGYSSPALAGAFLGMPGATMVGPQNFLGAMQMLRGIPGLSGPINQGTFTGRALKGIS